MRRIQKNSRICQGREGERVHHVQGPQKKSQALPLHPTKSPNQVPLIVLHTKPEMHFDRLKGDMKPSAGPLPHLSGLLKKCKCWGVKAFRDLQWTGKLLGEIYPGSLPQRRRKLHHFSKIRLYRLGLNPFQ